MAKGTGQVNAVARNYAVANININAVIDVFWGGRALVKGWCRPDKLQAPYCKVTSFVFCFLSMLAGVAVFFYRKALRKECTVVGRRFAFPT
ncbi:MAG: hypothetical protein RPS47_18765 [Colwellia sp.]